MKKDNLIYDCIIIGGGPGGLMAGIYLARFRCNILIIDEDESRAALIPTSHNFPLQKRGISGKEILKRLKKQYRLYRHPIIKDKTLRIIKTKQGFSVVNKHSKLQTKYLILATGVKDIEPNIPNLVDSIQKGLIRHCLICDGFEVINKKLAIIGHGKELVHNGMLLKTYSSQITLFSTKPYLSKYYLKKLRKANLAMIFDPILSLKIKNRAITIFTKSDRYNFDTVYSSLGAKPRSELGIALGIKHSKKGALYVNKYQQTSLAKCYAIGDIVEGLNQMCTAMSEAAIAATDIFNRLKDVK